MKHGYEFMKLLALILCSFLLFGCSFQHSISDKYTYEEYPGEGLLLGSFSMEEKAKYKFFDMTYFYEPLDTNILPVKNNIVSRRRPKKIAYFSDLGFNNSHVRGVNGQESDFDNTRGHVFAKSFPVGKYRLHRWNIASSFNTSLQPKKLDPIYFEIKEGESTYLGNLHVFVYGAPSVTDAFVIFKDERLRDMELLKKKFSIINDVSYQVPSKFSWAPYMQNSEK
jgi:hypothetical protein